MIGVGMWFCASVPWEICAASGSKGCSDRKRRLARSRRYFFLFCMKVVWRITVYAGITIIAISHMNFTPAHSWPKWKEFIYVNAYTERSDKEIFWLLRQNHNKFFDNFPKRITSIITPTAAQQNPATASPCLSINYETLALGGDVHLARRGDK